ERRTPERLISCRAVLRRTALSFSGVLAVQQSTLRAFDLAHLAHLELVTPKPEESLNFFVNIMGLTESGREGDSVYLRGWDDYEFHTLKLTAGKFAEMRHMAFQFYSPDGHNMELYWETKWYEAPEHLKPSLKNQSMRFPARGCNVRRLDHLNLLAADVVQLQKFFEDGLGMRTTEMIQLNSGEVAGVWVTATNKTYDVAFTHDHYNAKGRFHHATFAIDTREEILRAADIFLEHGVHIETGPHKHAVQQTFFLYVYEPGGNRVEVANAGARLMLAPDWQPVIWTETERKKGQAWGLKTIETFHTHGTPPVKEYQGPRRE